MTFARNRKTTLLAVLGATILGLGAAQAGQMIPPAGATMGSDARYAPLPAETTEPFRKAPASVAVDAKPEIETLQDRQAEMRWRQQLDQARAREAMKAAAGAANPAEAAALNRDLTDQRRAPQLPGRVSAEDLAAGRAVEPGSASPVYR